MKIVDKNGNEKEIRNLVLAIMQADDYRQYRFLNPTQQYAEGWKFNEYWEDVYQKLILLDGQRNTGNSD